MLTWWRDPRSRLVVLYGALAVASFVMPALPGEVEYDGGAGLGLSIALQLVLLFFMGRGSRVAVGIALFIDALILLGVLLSTGGVGADVGALIAVLVAQAAILIRLLLLRPPALRPSGA